MTLPFAAVVTVGVAAVATAGVATPRVVGALLWALAPSGDRPEWSLAAAGVWLGALEVWIWAAADLAARYDSTGHVVGTVMTGAAVALLALDVAGGSS